MHICIPRTGTADCHDNDISGLSDHGKELCHDSYDVASALERMREPHHGPVSESHHISRARYHKAIRSVIKNSDRIRTVKMAEAIPDNRTTDLFKEARKIKGRYNAKPGSVDECTGNKNIKFICR